MLRDKNLYPLLPHRLSYFMFQSHRDYANNFSTLKNVFILFRMKCNEAPEETPTVSEERLLQLSCFINQGKIYFSHQKFISNNFYY